MKVTYVGHMGSDLSVVNSARVSFGKKSEWKYPSSTIQGTGASLAVKDKKLIKYLASHGHTSPFNHTYVTMHIKAPIFVARQLVKHKFMPFNELSRRYVDSEPEFYLPEFRSSVKDKKQGSGGYVGDEQQQKTWFDFDRVQIVAVNAYKNALLEGVAPEQARAILPVSLFTEWYWSGTLGAWTGMYNLRAKPDTQWETQQVAYQAGEILKSLFPVSFKELTI